MGLDFFRAPPGRYLGYCHALSSSLPVSPVTSVWMSRVTFAYITFDVVNKAMDKRRPNFVSKSIDCVVWQGIASLIIPTFIVRGAGIVSQRINTGMKIQSPTNRYVSLGFVLLSLPLLGGIVDSSVDLVLDHTIRPILFAL